MLLEMLQPGSNSVMACGCSMAAAVVQHCSSCCYAASYIIRDWLVVAGLCSK